MLSAFRNFRRFGLAATCMLLGGLPSFGEDDASAAILEKLATLEETYRKEYLERSAKASDDYIAGLTSLEETLRSLGREAAAKRVADERLKHQKERKALRGKDESDNTDTSSNPEHLSSNIIVVDISRAVTKGGVVFNDETKSLVGWQAREAQAKIDEIGVPPGVYEVWLEYACSASGRLRMRVQDREIRSTLPITESLETYRFTNITELFLTESGDVVIVVSTPQAQPRDFFRLRKLELRRKPESSGSPE